MAGSLICLFFYIVSKLIKFKGIKKMKICWVRHVGIAAHRLRLSQISVSWKISTLRWKQVTHFLYQLPSFKSIPTFLSKKSLACDSYFFPLSFSSLLFTLSSMLLGPPMRTSIFLKSEFISDNCCQVVLTRAQSGVPPESLIFMMFYSVILGCFMILILNNQSLNQIVPALPISHFLELPKCFTTRQAKPWRCFLDIRKSKIHF